MQSALPTHVPNYRLSIAAAWSTVGRGMDYGRLIRVNKPSGKIKAAAYVVALPDSADAIKLITRKIAEPGDTVEDLGRVSDALLIAMKLEPGDFTRA